MQIQHFVLKFLIKSRYIIFNLILMFSTMIKQFVGLRLIIADFFKSLIDNTLSWTHGRPENPLSKWVKTNIND